MKKFHFSLQRMLDYKRTLLDREKDVLHAIHAERIAEERHQEETEARLWELDTTLHESAAHGTTALAVQQLNFTIESTRAVLEQIAQALVAIEKRIEAQTQAVVLLSQEVSGLERLEEKQREEYNYAARRAETETIGEIVAARYTAKQKEPE